jgi:hypothetical protein
MPAYIYREASEPHPYALEERILIIERKPHELIDNAIIRL